MKVVVIEDHQRVIEDISFCLKVRYPEAIIAAVAEGEKGLEMVEAESPDLVLVGSSLPDMEAPDLVSRIREFSDVPLIVISEAQTDLDRARILEAGADDIVTKLFNPIELLATIRALLRRTQGLGFKPERVVSVGDGLTINFAARQVFLQSTPIKLTPIEYNLLSVLVRNEGKVVTHRTLLEKVWGAGYASDYSFLKKYVYRLRSKLEPNGRPTMILTEWGIGYRFVKPV